jgi:hypothetical protein
MNTLIFLVKATDSQLAAAYAAVSYESDCWFHYGTYSAYTECGEYDRCAAEAHALVREYDACAALVGRRIEFEELDAVRRIQIERRVRDACRALV